MTGPVLLIKMRDLAGHTVRIYDAVVSRNPFWYRVDSVESASAPANVGHVWWLFGERVRTDGKPTVRKMPATFESAHNIIAVR